MPNKHLIFWTRVVQLYLKLWNLCLLLDTPLETQTVFKYQERLHVLNVVCQRITHNTKPIIRSSYPVIGVLVFLPKSWIILDNLEFLAKILDFFSFIAKILDILDFLPRSWQLILPRNLRSCQWKSEKKITVVFITIN